MKAAFHFWSGLPPHSCAATARVCQAVGVCCGGGGTAFGPKVTLLGAALGGSGIFVVLLDVLPPTSSTGLGGPLSGTAIPVFPRGSYSLACKVNVW